MFKVNLRTGETLDFGGMCNRVDYSSDKVMAFKHFRDNKSFYILALVPYDMITSVISEKDEVKKPKKARKEEAQDDR